MSEITITKCFEKYGVVKADAKDDVSADAEFDALVKELCYQITSEEFVSFDDDIDAYDPVFDTSEENWREVLQSEYIDIVFNEEFGVESDDEIKDVMEEVVNAPSTPSECLELLDKLMQVLISNEKMSLPNSITKRFERAVSERKT